MKLFFSPALRRHPDSLTRLEFALQPFFPGGNQPSHRERREGRKERREEREGKKERKKERSRRAKKGEALTYLCLLIKKGGGEKKNGKQSRMKLQSSTLRSEVCETVQKRGEEDSFCVSTRINICNQR